MELSLKNISRHDIHDKIYYYALILTAITLPFSLFANSFAIIILTANWIAEGRFAEKIKSLKNNLPFLLFMLFYALHLIGMLYTNNTDNGLMELQKKLPLLALPLIIATSHKLTTTQVNGILKSFLFSVLGASLVCLTYAFYRNAIDLSPNTDWLYFSYRDLTEIINIQATYLALYVCFSIFILFYFTNDCPPHSGWLKKISFPIIMLYLVIFLFLLASRTAIAAFVIILFSGTIWFYYKKKQLLKGAIVLILGILCLIAFANQIPVIKERFMSALGIEHKDVWINQYGDGKGTVPDVRILQWKCAWNIIKKNWLMGLGTGDVQDALQMEYKNINFEVAFQQEFNAHNQFIETWLGLGVVGLIALLSCNIATLTLSIQKKDYLHLSFIVLFIICSLTESLLCRQNGIVFFALFTSLFCFSEIKNENVYFKQIRRNF